MTKTMAMTMMEMMMMRMMKMMVFENLKVQVESQRIVVDLR